MRLAAFVEARWKEEEVDRVVVDDEEEDEVGDCSLLVGDSSTAAGSGSTERSSVVIVMGAVETVRLCLSFSSETCMGAADSTVDERTATTGE